METQSAAEGVLPCTGFASKPGILLSSCPLHQRAIMDHGKVSLVCVCSIAEATETLAGMLAAEKAVPMLPFICTTLELFSQVWIMLHLLLIPASLSPASLTCTLLKKTQMSPSMSVLSHSFLSWYTVVKLCHELYWLYIWQRVYELKTHLHISRTVHRRSP